MLSCAPKRMSGFKRKSACHLDKKNPFNRSAGCGHVPIGCDARVVRNELESMNRCCHEVRGRATLSLAFASMAMGLPRPGVNFEIKEKKW